MVSIDVIFDEKKAWDWSSTTNQNDCEPSMPKVPHEGYIEDGDDNDHDHDQEPINQDDKEEEDTDHNANQDSDSQPLVTRHCRIITKPRYLDDYVLLADKESEIFLVTIDGEPEKFLEAEHKRMG